jgi:hypothetical protein
MCGYDFAVAWEVGGEAEYVNQSLSLSVSELRGGNHRINHDVRECLFRACQNLVISCKLAPR